MAVILYRFADGHREELEVMEEFAAEYAEMEHRDILLTARKQGGISRWTSPRNAGLTFPIRRQMFLRK